MTFDDFSQVEIKNVGIELAKAREVLNKTSVDFVLDLRTTKHHINAIEEGKLRIFYGPPFYLDLLRRYALALNFSEAKILQLEQRVTNKYVQDEGKDAPVDEKVVGSDLKVNSRHPHTTPARENPGKSKIFSRSTSTSYSQLRMKYQEKNKLLEKNRTLLRYAYGLVLVAITAVYFLDDREKLPVKKIASKTSFLAATTQQKTEGIIEESAYDNGMSESKEYTVLLNEISDGVNNKNEDFANKKLEFDELNPFIVSKEINLERLEIDRYQALHSQEKRKYLFLFHEF